MMITMDDVLNIERGLELAGYFVDDREPSPQQIRDMDTYNLAMASLCRLIVAFKQQNRNTA